jgi:upstream activation factor subunit UAF30
MSLKQERAESKAGKQPSQAQLRAAMEVVLSEADVSDMTLKSIRMNLEAKFGCSLEERKEVLKICLAELMDAGEEEEEEKEAASDSDSDSEAKSKPAAKKKQNAFTKPVQLSTNLADFFGQHTMPRTEVTKRIWVYIKEHGLQNPKDKREIICDAKLLKVFDGRAKVNMFKMTKYLSSMMKPLQDLVDEPSRSSSSSSSKKRKSLPADSDDEDDEDEPRSKKAKKVSKKDKKDTKDKKKSKKESAAADADADKKKKLKKKKAAATSSSSSSSIDAAEMKEKPKGGYNKECALNGRLAALIGCPALVSRPAVVKKMWEYIRLHSLQNPADKREILLDASLKQVFGKDLHSFTMFSMNKYLSDHIKAVA